MYCSLWILTLWNVIFRFYRNQITIHIIPQQKNPCPTPPQATSQHIVKTMDILAKALSDVLARVASDYRLDHAELISRYLSGPPPASLPQPQPQPPQTNLCTARTAKGAPCKYKPQKGSCVCKIHASKTQEAPPEPIDEVPKTSKKKKTPKKAKAPAPEHTHALTEDLSPDNVCQLCDTHGSVLDPGMPEAEFELADDLEEPDLAARLKAILSEEPLDEEEDLDEEDLAEDEDFEDDQVILARLKAITSSSNSLTVSVAELLS